MIILCTCSLLSLCCHPLHLPCHSNQVWDSISSDTLKTQTKRQFLPRDFPGCKGYKIFSPSELDFQQTTCRTKPSCTETSEQAVSIFFFFFLPEMLV